MSNILFRSLRPEENIEDGLFCKNADAGFSVMKHVGNGGSIDSEFISLSSSPAALLRYNLWKNIQCNIAAINENALIFTPEDCVNRSDWSRHQPTAERFGNAFQERCVPYHVNPDAIECFLVREEDFASIDSPMTDDDRAAVAEAVSVLNTAGNTKYSPVYMATIADRFSAQYSRNPDGGYVFGKIILNRFSDYEISVECSYTGTKEEIADAWRQYFRNDTSSGYAWELSDILDKGVLTYIENGDYERAGRLFVAIGKELRIIQEICRDELHKRQDAIFRYRTPEVPYERELDLARDETIPDEAREDAEHYFNTMPNSEIERYNPYDCGGGITAVWGETKGLNMLKEEFGGELYENGHKWIGTAPCDIIKQHIEDGLCAEYELFESAKASVFEKTPDANAAYEEAKSMHDVLFNIPHSDYVQDIER